MNSAYNRIAINLHQTNETKSYTHTHTHTLEYGSECYKHYLIKTSNRRHCIHIQGDIQWIVRVCVCARMILFDVLQSNWKWFNTCNTEKRKVWGRACACACMFMTGLLVALLQPQNLIQLIFSFEFICSDSILFFYSLFVCVASCSHHFGMMYDINSQRGMLFLKHSPSSRDECIVFLFWNLMFPCYTS